MHFVKMVFVSCIAIFVNASCLYTSHYSKNVLAMILMILFYFLKEFKAIQANIK